MDKEHWDNVYLTKTPHEVSWFQKHASRSLELIERAGVPRTASIIDVGGGASVLVDDLIANGFGNITVVDVSEAALDRAKSRLGSRSADVQWMLADVLHVDLPMHGYGVWHDRAMFHFITSDEGRRAYVNTVCRAVEPGGLVIIATFAEDGPTKCSGLPVVRYSVKELEEVFSSSFQLQGYEFESHDTPNGSKQKFIYCYWRRIAE
jgi:ubiquinone/menaquinone biosynthesis C-methylase UbiE